MALPTDEQREVWERFSKASRESVEATEDEEGKERMESRADYISDVLDGFEAGGEDE